MFDDSLGIKWHRRKITGIRFSVLAKVWAWVGLVLIGPNGRKWGAPSGDYLFFPRSQG